MSLKNSLRVLCVLAVVAAGLGADEPITLRYKAKPGDQLVYRNRNSTDQVQKIGEFKIENKLSQEELSSIVKSVGVDTLTLLGNRLDLVPTFQMLLAQTLAGK